MSALTSAVDEVEFDALELRLADALLELAGAYAHAGGRLTHARAEAADHRMAHLDEVDRLVTAARASAVIIRALFDEVPQP